MAQSEKSVSKTRITQTNNLCEASANGRSDAQVQIRASEIGKVSIASIGPLEKNVGGDVMSNMESGTVKEQRTLEPFI